MRAAAGARAVGCGCDVKVGCGFAVKVGCGFAVGVDGGRYSAPGVGLRIDRRRRGLGRCEGRLRVDGGRRHGAGPGGTRGAGAR